MKSSTLKSHRRLLGTLALLFLGTCQWGFAQTTNVIPSHLYLTDDGFLFLYNASGGRMVRVSAIRKAERNPESWPAAEDPNEHWGNPTNGLQLSIRLDRHNLASGGPILATTIIRNITNSELTYYFPVEVTATKNGSVLKRKDKPPGLSLEITMLPMKTLYPQTQNKDVRNLSSEYDLDQNGEYVFQAVCRHPEVNSEPVIISITNSLPK